VVPTVFQLIALWVLMAYPQMGAPAQAPARVETRSPHGKLDIPCQNCHTFSGWKPVRSIPEFDHNKTRYPLRGMHTSVGCTDCHTKPVFTNVSNKCADCHADLHRGQFGSRCEACHTVKGWLVSLQSIREHQNRFPLVGAHSVAQCADCHKGAATGQFQGLSTQCATCHMPDYQRATVPNHVALRFPTDCQGCHNSMDTWLGAKFDHGRFTGFVLTGSHSTLDCASCHVGGRYQGTPADCVGCHARDYTGATNPNHVQANFPKSCAMCHTTGGWSPASFDHAAVTGYALTGAHTSLGCTQCHANGNYTNTSASCSSCHMKDYNGTTNPNHVSAGLPTDCAVCHSTTSWAGATFNHANTGFPLTGAHTPLNCSSCHANNVFTGLSPNCASCHLTNYNQTTSPNHVAAALPQTCQVCHSTTAWTPATFNHNNTSFPLTGAHTHVTCANCHVNNQYAGTPKDCYSCHRPDYQGTTNPNHVAAGFPTTCTTCHNTTAWTGATFSHTWFPIYSGAHQGKWTTCGDCHTNSSNYAAFSCITCHAHDKATTDSHHREVHNYVYNSANCYSCHPAGRAD
jgi:predicted CXXCH cytochrome family protein